MIGIIDYGSGNVKAVANIYKKLNITFFIAKTPEDLKNATHLVLPGVGAFDQTMNLLNHSGLREELDKLVIEKKIPVIGICVGMQIMAESSEEGTERGLGWIKGDVKRIDQSKLKRKPKLPHMGWNNILFKKENFILSQTNSKKGFYFLHSYFIEPQNHEDIVATVEYGSELTCVVRRDNIVGIQFHPEKSHDNGVQIFKNFASI